MARTARRIGSASPLLAVLITLTLATPVPAVAATAAGTPYSWGGNAFGELGSQGTSSRSSAGPVAGLTDVVDLHTGREHTVALRANGTVVTWGSNQMGQLGIGSIGGTRSSPVAVTSLSDVVAVSTGHYHSLALRVDGSIWTWGYNHAGQLGDGTVASRSTPVRISGSRTYTSVAAGRDMSYAVATDGTVWAWGLNGDGQLGDGTTTNRLSPVQVTTGATMAAAGAHHSYALLGTGQVLSWGRNYRAALGDGTTTQRTRPVTVQGVTNATWVGAGRDHGIAVLGDGTARAWGHNASGKLGDGTTTNRTSAVAVTGLSGAVKASGGAEFTVALTNDAPPPPPPPPPPPDGVDFRAAAGTNRNATTTGVVVPAAVRAGDRLLLFVSANRNATVTTPSGWTLLATHLDGTDLRSWAFTRVAVAGTAGANVPVVMDGQAKVDVTVIAHSGAGPVQVHGALGQTGTGTSHPAPASTVATAGSRVVHHWVTKTNAVTTWTLPAGLVGRSSATGSGSGQLSSVTADGGPAAAGPWAGRAATASVSSAKAIGWTVVIAPE